jgi:hypothetical protein
MPSSPLSEAKRVWEEATQFGFAFAEKWFAGRIGHGGAPAAATRMSKDELACLVAEIFECATVRAKQALQADNARMREALASLVEMTNACVDGDGMSVSECDARMLAARAALSPGKTDD